MFKVAKVLLNAGADPDAKNKIGQTPLIYACIENHVAMARLLLQVKFFANIQKYLVRHCC